MIENPIQTRRALLAWQLPLDDSGRRDRYAVAELVQCDDGVSFRYLDKDSIADALIAGFRNHPGLPMDADNLDRIAIEVLMHRLPPRNRRDFKEVLGRFGLPADRDYTDLSLLAYTGARLTSDTFSVCDTFDGFEPPFTYVFDVAGYRHHRRDSDEEATDGDQLWFARERDNPRDRDAVRINRADGSQVGYVNRLQSEKVGVWLDQYDINASVFRINGRAEYPRMFVRAEVSALGKAVT